MQIMKNPTALVWGKKSAFQCASPRADVTVVMMVWYQSLLADYCHRLFALEILAGLQCSVFGFKRHADAVCRFLLRIQWFSRRRRYYQRQPFRLAMSACNCCDPCKRLGVNPFHSDTCLAFSFFCFRFFALALRAPCNNPVGTKRAHECFSYASILGKQYDVHPIFLF